MAIASTGVTAVEGGRVDSNKISIVPLSMPDAQSATYAMKDEDHTLGNALRYIIMKNPEVDFSGYSIPHPSEAVVNIRIQTTNNTTALETMYKGLDDLNDICQHVKDTFDAELAKGEFIYEDETVF